MATFIDPRIKDDSQTTIMGEEISVKRGFHVPPLTGATVKESKKKKKDTNKKKSTTEVNQSKNSVKLQTVQWANGEMSDAQSKGHVKAKERRNKPKNPKVVSEALVPTEEDCTHQLQDSLRWEGVLEDPVAEAQRLEVYRANRRKRYLASKQDFL